MAASVDNDDDEHHVVKTAQKFDSPRRLSVNMFLISFGVDTYVKNPIQSLLQY